MYICAQFLGCTQLYQNTEITVLNKVRSLSSVHLFTVPRLYTAIPVYGDNSFKQSTKFYSVHLCTAPRLYTAVPVHGDNSFKQCCTRTLRYQLKHSIQVVQCTSMYSYSAVHRYTCALRTQYNMYSFSAVQSMVWYEGFKQRRQMQKNPPRNKLFSFHTDLSTGPWHCLSWSNI